MKDSKTICTNIEGLLPLYVGGDLEKDQLDSVSEHLKGCTDCAEAFSRSRLARGLLRTELFDLVDGREPQLWPALREQLQAEGLFKQAASGAPGGASQSSPSKLEPAASTPILSLPRWRRTAGLAAGIAAVFMIGKLAPFGTPDGTQDPVNSVDSQSNPLVADGEPVEDEVKNQRNSGFSGTLTSGGNSFLAGAGVPNADTLDPNGPSALTEDFGEQSGTLRPVGFDERSLGEIARDNLLRERQAGQMFYLVSPNPVAPSQSGVGLVNSYSLQ